MTNDTDKLLEKLLDRQALDEHEKACIANDEELTSVSEFLQAIKGVDLGEAPPSTIDNAILANARKQAAQPKTPMVVYVRLGLAAAAAFLIVMIVLQLLPNPNASSNTIAGPDSPKGDKAPIVQPDTGDDPQPDQRIVKKTPQDKGAGDDTLPSFDWGDDGEFDAELAMLEAELFLNNMNDSDAVLVENF